MNKNIKNFISLAFALSPALSFAQSASNYPLVGDNGISVSYPDDLGSGPWSCAYANNFQVQFQANTLPFAVTDISVYINGSPAPASWISEQWPNLTVLHGLHPGYNTIELVASSQDGQGVSRVKQVILGGNLPATYGDSNYIDCDSSGMDVNQDYSNSYQNTQNSDGTIVDSSSPVFLNYVIQPVYPPVIIYYGGAPYYSYRHPHYSSNPPNTYSGNNGWNWNNGGRGGIPPVTYHNPPTTSGNPVYNSGGNSNNNNYGNNNSPYHMPVLNADPHPGYVQENNTQENVIHLQTPVQQSPVQRIVTPVQAVPQQHEPVAPVIKPATPPHAIMNINPQQNK